LNKEAFNAAMTSGDFHMVFSETWGAPYDPVSYVTSWMANNEAHYSAMGGVTGDNSRANIFAKVDLALAEAGAAKRSKLWGEVHSMVHQTAVNLPLWGKKIPSVLNQRLHGYHAGYQQFDYPVHRIVVQSGSKTVTIAPGAQTGLFNTVGRLDPHSYRPNEFFANNWVYESLVSYGEDGAIVPALAESWTETADGLGFTFTLRQGVKFHDGEAWNCAVAKLNFDHFFAAPFRTTDWHGWYGLPLKVASWSCTDDFTFVMKMDAPYSNLLQELTFIRPTGMLSPASFYSTAADSWMTNNSCPTGWEGATLGDVTVVCSGIKAPIGTGPFKYVSRTADGDNDAEVVFHGFTDYWAGAPDIEKLIIKRFATASAVAAAMSDGSLDMVVGDGVLAPADLVAFMNGGKFNIVRTSVLMHSLIIINSGKKPTDASAVRKAIIHGVDKASIIEKELGGLAEAADRMFPRSAPYSNVELTPRWDYDMEKATLLNCPPPPPTTTPAPAPAPEPSPSSSGPSPSTSPSPSPSPSNEETANGSISISYSIFIPMIIYGALNFISSC
jgi:ABC-type transport system substrate-binding protein